MQNNALLSVTEARENILKNILPLDSEPCLVENLHNRVLAENLYARLSHPAEAVSAMDGYAAHLSDITKVPTILPEIGVSAAGHAFTNPILSGQLVRIFTGALVPEGADTIILQEDTIKTPAGIEIQEIPKLGQFIRPAGFDFLAGYNIITARTVLSARDCALIALAGHHEVPVIRKPKIGVLTSGDELVTPGQVPKAGQLINSNNLLLSTLILAAGGEPIDLGILPDKAGALIKRIDSYPELDIIITTGGASVGDHDHIAKDLDENTQSELNFWKIAMRPGKPLMFGHYKNTPLLGMPGNPVSAGVCAVLFLVPIIKKFLGLSPEPVFSTAQITTNLPENDRREDYLRAITTIDDAGITHVTPAKRQDSSMLATLSKADCLIQRPALAPQIEKGTRVQILYFPHSF